MRKLSIFMILMVCLLSTSAFAVWDVSRSINNNDITLTITPADGFDTFTITETIVGGQISDGSWTGSCGLVGTKMTCDFDGTNVGTITYSTTGSGSITGSADAVNSNTFSVETKTISGDTTIPNIIQPTCTNECIDGSKQCSTSGNRIQVCRDDNGDGCTEWVASSYCLTGQTCSNGACVQVTTTSCVESDWSIGSWSTCSKECGGGTQTRDALKNVGNTCVGGFSPILEQSCNTQACAPTTLSLGAEIDKVMTEEGAVQGDSTSWTIKLITRIATIFKLYFS